MKIVQYLSITKRVNTIKLIDLFFTKVALKFGTLKGIITNRKSLFTSTF